MIRKILEAIDEKMDLKPSKELSPKKGIHWSAASNLLGDLGWELAKQYQKGSAWVRIYEHPGQVGTGKMIEVAHDMADGHVEFMDAWHGPSTSTRKPIEMTLDALAVAANELAAEKGESVGFGTMKQLLDDHGWLHQSSFDQGGRTYEIFRHPKVPPPAEIHVGHDKQGQVVSVDFWDGPEKTPIGVSTGAVLAFVGGLAAGEQGPAATAKGEDVVLEAVRQAILEVMGLTIADNLGIEPGDEAAIKKVIEKSTFTGSSDPGQWAPEAHVVVHHDKGVPEAFTGKGYFEEWVKVGDRASELIGWKIFDESINPSVSAFWDA